MYNTKSFNPDLYNLYDSSAKRKLISYLQSVHKDIEFVEEPFGKYDIDLAFKLDSLYYLVDVEVRPVWESGKFPYGTIHLPARKLKFVHRHAYRNVPVFFVAFRKDLQAFMVINGISVKDGRVLEMDNIYARNESFVDIPTNECLFVELNSE